jgi:hypothetical protein
MYFSKQIFSSLKFKGRTRGEVEMKEISALALLSWKQCWKVNASNYLNGSREYYVLFHSGSKGKRNNFVLFIISLPYLSLQ